MLKRTPSIYAISVLIFVGLLLTTYPESQAQSTDNDNVVEVVTNLMDLKVEKNLKSGWTTFRYINKSAEPHFFILEKMPEGKNIQNYRSEIIPPYMRGYSALIKGDMEAGMKEFATIPEWFTTVTPGGGVGLTSAKSTTESMIYLEPGLYVMECYVRMPNGMAHALMGMIAEVVVSDENNGNKPPQHDLEVTISTDGGIVFEGTVKPGDHTFSVYFKDQQPYPAVMGHDVHLVKLDSPDLLGTLAQWVNVPDVTAFRSPAPKGLTFLGGVEEQLAGQTAYFKASLTPGYYVLISEVGGALDLNLYHEFEVK